MSIGIEIIPVLDVCKSCHWCEPQECWHASVWWGDVLMTFYTTTKERLEPDALNSQACECLRQLTKGIKPGSDTIITPEELQAAMGGSTILLCRWNDFAPAMSIVCSNIVNIPVLPPADELAEERARFDERHEGERFDADFDGGVK